MFPGDDISRLIPENVRTILSDLKKKPIEYEKWFYGSLKDEFYQGDILKNIVIYRLDERGGPSPHTGPAIVVSHTCDCQPDQSEFILVAPIFRLADLKPTEDLTEEEIADFKRDLQNNGLKEQVFLPAIGSLPDSWLDLSQIFSISSECFHSASFKPSRVASLSQKGHYFFLMRLSYHLCRPDPIDSKRSG